MFDNIGGKIKTLATVVCWIGIVVSVIYGLVLLDYSAAAGILTMVLGSLLSWISSFTLYGFGQLIEKTTEIAHVVQTRLPNANATAAPQAKPTITCPVCRSQNTLNSKFCAKCGTNLIPDNNAQ